MTRRQLFFQIVLVFVLCVLAETVSYIILRARHQSVGFLLNLNLHNEVTETKGFGFDEIDPLCGWSMSNKRIENMGYKTKQNCEVLECHGTWPAEPIRIFVTGGSTSDIALHNDNWPLELQKIMTNDSVNATIYVGAVGGYTSGQELLKLMRDGMKICPDIHISYTGANEGSDSGYVSEYERDFYQGAYAQNYAGSIMPSTLFLIKSSFHLGYIDLSIKKTEPTHAYDFWRQNMAAMGGIAYKGKYSFLGVLQPVLGMGHYHQANEKEIDPGGYSKGYKQYYPQAQEYIKVKDSTLTDLTGVFDTATKPVYIDDCHINASYQRVVAESIYKELKQRGYLRR